MSRLTDALIPDGKGYRFAEAPIVDLRRGGQFGETAMLGGPNETEEWISNSGYVRRDLIAIMLSAPKLFGLLPDPEIWIGSLKAWFEVHSETIDGLNMGLNVDSDTHPLSGSGQLQHEFTDVKETPSAPVHAGTEKYGMPIFNLHNFWIRYCMMSPETKYATIMTLAGSDKRKQDLNLTDDMLADMYTATVAYIEPDPTHTKVIKCWIVGNMYPTSTGEEIGKADKNSPKELVRRSIEYTGFAQNNMGTLVVGQQLLDEINKSRINPFLRNAFLSKRDAESKDVGGGYLDALKIAEKDVVKP